MQARFFAYFAATTILTLASAAYAADVGGATEATATVVANRDAIGLAGSYALEDDGHITVSGERFDMYRLTAASNELPLGAFVEVTNLTTGARAVLKINDRRAPSGQIVTLSYAAANRLGLPDTGAGQVQVRFLGMTAPDATQTRYAAR